MQLLKKMIAAGLLLGASSGAHAIVFTEVGDAGNLLATSQSVANGTTQISGLYAGPIDQDLFAFSWGGGQFIADTSSGVGPLLGDPQLFLFDSAGDLVFGNDDTGSLQSQISIASLASGAYYIALSQFNDDPLNALNQNMCLGNCGATASAPGPLAGWSLATSRPTGNYSIFFNTAVNAAVPEPAMATLLGLALLGAGAAGRRKRA